MAVSMEKVDDMRRGVRFVLSCPRRAYVEVIQKFDGSVWYVMGRRSQVGEKHAKFVACRLRSGSTYESALAERLDSELLNGCLAGTRNLK